MLFEKQKRVDQMDRVIENYFEILLPLLNQFFADGNYSELNGDRCFNGAKKLLKLQTDEKGDRLGISAVIEEDKLAIKNTECSKSKLLKKHKCASISELKDIFSEQKRFNDLCNEKQENRNVLKSHLKDEQLEDFILELSESNITDIEHSQNTLKDDEKTLAEQLEELNKGKLEKELALEKIKNYKLSEHNLKKNQLIEEARLHIKSWQKSRIAEYIFTNAKEKFQRDQQPDVVVNASKFFKNITAGRYSEIRIGFGDKKKTKDDEMVTVIDWDKKAKEPRWLSMGTRKQLYLALRLGFIEHFLLNNSASLPLIADEITSDMGSNRTDRILSKFSDFSQSNQILIFTNNETVLNKCREIFQDSDIINAENFYLKDKQNKFMNADTIQTDQV